MQRMPNSPTPFYHITWALKSPSHLYHCQPPPFSQTIPNILLLLLAACISPLCGGSSFVPQLHPPPVFFLKAPKYTAMSVLLPAIDHSPWYLLCLVSSILAQTHLFVGCVSRSPPNNRNVLHPHIGPSNYDLCPCPCTTSCYTPSPSGSSQRVNCRPAQALNTACRSAQRITYEYTSNPSGSSTSTSTNTKTRSARHARSGNLVTSRQSMRRPQPQSNQQCTALRQSR